MNGSRVASSDALSRRFDAVSRCLNEYDVQGHMGAVKPCTALDTYAGGSLRRNPKLRIFTLTLIFITHLFTTFLSAPAQNEVSRASASPRRRKL